MSTTLEKNAVSLAGFKAVLKGKGAAVARNVKAVTNRAVENATPAIGKVLDKTVKAQEAVTLTGIKIHDKFDHVMNTINPGAARRITEAGFNPAYFSAEMQAGNEIIGGAIHHGKNLVNKIIKK